MPRPNIRLAGWLAHTNSLLRAGPGNAFFMQFLDNYAQPVCPFEAVVNRLCTMNLVTEEVRVI
jgi:hypothetical protein